MATFDIALPPKPMQKRLFTCSTQVFASLKEAEDKLEEWSGQGKLNPDTRVYEIKNTRLLFTT